MMKIQNMLMELTTNPVFGVFITLVAYYIASKISEKVNNTLAHPLLIGSILIMLFLYITGISVEDYQEGGSIITFFMGIITVALALPLYKQFHLLVENFLPIILGISAGVIVAVISGGLLGELIGLDYEMIMSLIPKNISTPFAVELSESIGGIPALTTALVIIAGMVGVVLGGKLLKLFNINNPTAQGIAYGTSSHALGTSKALSVDEKLGAMSSLSMGLAGLITTLIGPIVLKIVMSL